MSWIYLALVVEIAHIFFVNEAATVFAQEETVIATPTTILYPDATLSNLTLINTLSIYCNFSIRGPRIPAQFSIFPPGKIPTLSRVSLNFTDLTNSYWKEIGLQSTELQINASLASPFSNETIIEGNTKYLQYSYNKLQIGTTAELATLFSKRRANLVLTTLCNVSTMQNNGLPTNKTFLVVAGSIYNISEIGLQLEVTTLEYTTGLTTTKQTPKKTWTQCKDICSNLGGTIVIIRSQAKQTEVSTAMSSAGIGQLWLGMKNVGDASSSGYVWCWIDDPNYTAAGCRSGNTATVFRNSACYQSYCNFGTMDGIVGDAARIFGSLSYQWHDMVPTAVYEGCACDVELPSTSNTPGEVIPKPPVNQKFNDGTSHTTDWTIQPEVHFVRTASTTVSFNSSLSGTILISPSVSVLPSVTSSLPIPRTPTLSRSRTSLASVSVSNVRTLSLSLSDRSVTITKVPSASVSLFLPLTVSLSTSLTSTHSATLSPKQSASQTYSFTSTLSPSPGVPQTATVPTTRTISKTFTASNSDVTMTLSYHRRFCAVSPLLYILFDKNDSQSGYNNPMNSSDFFLDSDKKRRSYNLSVFINETAANHSLDELWMRRNKNNNISITPDGNGRPWDSTSSIDGEEWLAARNFGSIKDGFNLSLLNSNSGSLQLHFSNAFVFNGADSGISFTFILPPVEASYYDPSNSYTIVFQLASKSFNECLTKNVLNFAALYLLGSKQRKKQPASNHLPEMLQTTTPIVVVASGAVFGALGSPGLALQQGRMLALLELSVCSFDHEEPLDWILNPTGLHFGPPFGQYYRGGTIGNYGMMVGVILGFLLLAVFMRCHPTQTKEGHNSNSKVSYTDALTQLRWPGMLIVVYVLLLEGIVMCSTATLLHGVGGCDIIIGGAGTAIVVLVYLLIFFKLFQGANKCICVNISDSYGAEVAESIQRETRSFPGRSDKKEDGAEDNIAKILEDEINSSGHETNETWKEVQTAKRNLEAVGDGYKDFLKNKWTIFFLGGKKWKDLDAPNSWYKPRYGVLFSDYGDGPRRYFLLVELFFSVAVGAMQGSRPEKQSTCTILIFSLVFANLVMLVSVLSLSPNIAGFNHASQVVITVFTFVTALFLFIAQYNEDELFMKIGQFLTVITIYITAAKALVDFFLFLQKFQLKKFKRSISANFMRGVKKAKRDAKMRKRKTGTSVCSLEGGEARVSTYSPSINKLIPLSPEEHELEELEKLLLPQTKRETSDSLFALYYSRPSHQIGSPIGKKRQEGGNKINGSKDQKFMERLSLSNWQSEEQPLPPSPYEHTKGGPFDQQQDYPTDGRGSEEGNNEARLRNMGSAQKEILSDDD